MKQSLCLPPVAEDQSQRKAVFTDKAVKPPLKSGEWNSITLSYAPAEREFADLFFYMNAGETVEVSWKPDLEFYGKMPAKNSGFLIVNPIRFPSTEAGC